ncbi:flavo protein WrbA, partial [Caulochytrium protostelioides]
IPEITVDDLAKPDGFLFGFGTRYGRPCAQFDTFWDKTGGLWAKGALAGKLVGCFTSTASQHGGQETTIMSALSNFVHHGMVFVPLGFGHPKMTNLSEVMGGSAWGASTIAAGDGSRQVSDVEKDIAMHQGKNFGHLLTKPLS